ncbi:MAG: DNA polymerase II, partial [Methanobacteriota archaeon]
MSESFDVRIITASYRREPVDGPEDPQVPVIQLFGRTREGKSIAIEYSGFKPYFFVIAPPQALRGAFARDKQVVAFEDVTLEVEGRPTPCARVVLRQPWKTPEYREKARKFGSTTRDPKGRYWTDLFLVAERFEPCAPFRPALRILSFDIENSIRDGHIFCIGVAYREAGEIKTRILTGNEKEIIERFVKLIDELDPDVISGYNIDGYDLPVLIERAAKHGMQRLSLARDHSTFFHLGERFWRLDGRILTDVWWAVRAEMRPKQETLDYVAKHLLGEGKHELQRRRIDEEWEADRDKVIRYCIQDAELSLRILERVRRIEKTLDLAAVSKLPLEDVLHGRTSNLIDSILIRAADRAKVAVPMMK